MDWLVTNIEILVKYGLPVLPYALIVLLTYQAMSRFIKPLVESHMTPSGAFTSKWWRLARKPMIFYPWILGALMGLPFQLHIGYAIGAGAASQLVYHLARDFLKKYDIEIPGDNSLPPPGQ